MWGTEVALQVWSPPTPGCSAIPTAVGDYHGMAPVVALEPLKNAVLVLSGAVLLLSLFLVLERAIVTLFGARSGQREERLTQLVYRLVQVEPGSSPGVGVLSRFDRRLVRGILLRMAPDLRGDSG